MKPFAFSFLLLVSLGGCAGYHVGSVKPGYLREVHSIAVPTFKNSTLMPRIEVLVTSTVIKQFQQDGTFQITTENNADAVLKGEIVRVARTPARSVRGNVLSTREFNFRIEVRYSLVARNGKRLTASSATSVAGDDESLTASSASGTTSFFVGSDIIADERQALPLAAEELATHLVSQISEGW